MATSEFDEKLNHQLQAVVPDTSAHRPQPRQIIGAPVTVLTTDADLCEAIRAAVMERHPVFTATRLEDAAEFASTGRCSILITDLALTQPALDRITRRLRTYQPALVTIAVGSREDNNVLIGLLSSGAADRLMVKPVTSALARIVIESAAREHKALKTRREQSPSGPRDECAPVPVPVDERSERTGVPQKSKFLLPPSWLEVPEKAPAPRYVASRKSGSIPRPPWIAVIAAIAAVGGAVWWGMFQRLPDIDPRQVITTNLSAAKLAFDERRYIDPSERSAVHYYSTVLALDPANAEARSGLDRIADRFIEDAKTSIIDGRFAEAVAALESVRRVRPEHHRLPFLDAQLRKELEKYVALQAQEPAEDGASPQRSGPAAKGALNGPNEVRVTRRAELDNVTVEESSRGSRTQIVSQADRVIERGPGAQLEVPAPRPAAPNETLSTSTPLLSQANETGSFGANIGTTQTGQPAASVATSAPPSIAPPLEPKRLKFVQPEYPSAALNRSIEGWVDVSLSVTASGDVVEPRVEHSSRRQLFDRAALAAVQQWKYEPIAGANPDFTQRVQVRLEFRLAD